MGKFFHEDFLLLTFLEILIVMIFYSWRFFRGWYFLKFCSWNCSIVNICSMVILRLKILVLVIWLGIIGLGSDFKIDANSGLEFEIWFTRCQIWRLKWLVNFGRLYGHAFCTIELFLLFFWVWWLLCDLGYDLVCFDWLIGYGKISLGICRNFVTFFKIFFCVDFLSLVD